MSASSLNGLQLAPSLAHRLGDTTNFLRAAGFFLTAISTAFLAELATLYLLGTGGLTEPYYWLAMLLASIPFVLICFFLIRIVEPLSLKDVLHLAIYPIGAGLFAGAALTLVAASVIALLTDIGFIPEIRYDFTQVAGPQHMADAYMRAQTDCLKQDSLIIPILAAGWQEAYTSLKPPIGYISFLRSVIGLFYLGLAAYFVMLAVGRRRKLVFSLVLLAGLLATGVNALATAGVLAWKINSLGCDDKKVVANATYRAGESWLKNYARELQAAGAKLEISEPWYVSIRAEGRTLSYTYRFKAPVDTATVHHWVDEYQKAFFEKRCSVPIMITVKALETHTVFSVDGQRLTSFSIDRSDCPQW